jgi:hypothetical protein
MPTTSPSHPAGQLDTDRPAAFSSASADRNQTRSGKSSGVADKSPPQTPPAIIDLARLLGRLAASEIVLGDDLAKRVLDGMPNSSDFQGMIDREVSRP